MYIHSCTASIALFNIRQAFGTTCHTEASITIVFPPSLSFSVVLQCFPTCLLPQLSIILDRNVSSSFKLKCGILFIKEQSNIIKDNHALQQYTQLYTCTWNPVLNIQQFIQNYMYHCEFFSVSFPESFRPPDLAGITLSLEGLVTLWTTKSERLKPIGRNRVSNSSM